MGTEPRRPGSVPSTNATEERRTQMKQPFNFEQMERELEAAVPTAPRERKLPDATHNAVQIIAHGITCLTWKEAEGMGNAIQSKMKEGSSLTAAIQSWAEEWESFR